MGCRTDYVEKIMWNYLGPEWVGLGCVYWLKIKVNYECVSNWLNGWDGKVMVSDNSLNWW